MRFSAVASAAGLAASLLIAPYATAQRPGSDTTNIFTPEMKFFANPDPRIAQYESSQRTGTPVRQIGAVELSPDGKKIAWIVGTEPVAGGGRRGGMQLHISPALSPSPSEPAISAGDGCSSSLPRWSPDGATLAFVGTCADHQPQIYLRDASGKVSQLTHIKGTLTSPTWAPDGSSIGFLYVENATRSAGALAAMKPPAGVVGQDGVEIQWVAAANAKTGEVSVVSPKTLHAYEFDWAPDSKHVAFIAANPPGENTWWIAQMYTVATGDPSSAKSILNPVTAGGSLHGLQIAVPRYSPDGRNIAFIGGLMSDQGSTGGDIYLMGSDGSGLQDLTTGRKSTPVYIAWADNDHIAFSEYHSGKSHLSVLGTNGKELLAGWTAPQSVASGRAAASFSFSPAAKMIAFTSAGPDKAVEVYAGDPRGIRAVTQINAHATSAASKTVSVEWDNDGFHVQGWLTLPENYDPAKKYPMIVSVHGGPSAEVGPSFGGAGAGLYAHLGYFLLQPNPRGSYGQGEAFVQANRKDFGYGDLRDILKGVDAAEKQYSIDDKRLGLTGWSYGGFMSMFAITQTNRFRAAVAGAGISNWQSYYGENSIDQWMVPFFGATVYDDPAVYAKSSAINFINKVTTPELILVGDRDGECPAPQSYEMWHALRALGKKTELVVYPNEGHGFTNPAHNADRTARTVAWFEDNMK
ncbi:S9 family peptidase [Terriglobus roseus]|uniref:Dipeptidyl aminopeptidase/acylaminoacyl peptidase n=1 Tax=Terriglobus roseus TaxID=392734 RepID=A0A1H4QHM6_9BACT|nr:S9 family peptidase [Terriglobus roseus]SEC19126.1 Dipeptidyl aminopeptidase/acylaminoacyl peptidase [Terriglobus roseus]